MNVFVFLGPSLSVDEAARQLPAVYLPPAAQGDVYLAARERPLAIGIVDGYFERIPAVWHKEILWALAHGVHVFGAASIGALRAAELAPFGMVGVGRVFDAFASGELEDDDEVAVAHGDASTGYRLGSEAMVNIRATLRAATRGGVIDDQLEQRLIRIAKRTFYAERSYPLVFANALEEGVGSADIDALRGFVAKRKVDQKRDDALSLLKSLERCVSEGRPAPPPRFSFAHTEAWNAALEWAEANPSLLRPPSEATVQEAGDRAARAPSAVAAEARLMGKEAGEVLARGWMRTFAGALARQLHVTDREDRVGALDRELRSRWGVDDASFERWMAAQDLTPASYASFLDRLVDLRWAREYFRDEMGRHVVDELRLRGIYRKLVDRAHGKWRALEERGLARAIPSDPGVDEDGLIPWYFEQRLGQAVPEDLDGFLEDAGLASRSALKREALREFLFYRLDSRRK